ncbi:Inositol-tetrakisphosphate 1-kinase [Macleaya cordata]|uniref:Inositol-tetrakisphosphate 1-kinase n=1 Tax=Macleaya cordata TaxID=56857 RepID=A0A200PM73_MACCD|nr:Inositol-tetrakisphosphate 1-kinase [Macleaya cordata]
MGAVRGVLLDESLLFAEDTHGNTFFHSGAESLLTRLQYSNLRTGISYEACVSAQKVTFLKEMAMLYSLDCFMLKASSMDASLSEILQAWGDIGGSCLYVASSKDEDLFLKLRDHGWLTVVKSTEGGIATEDSKVMLMNKLEELPLNLCRFSRKVTGNNVVRIGYVMKPSREQDFAKRGAFPMYPTQNGLMFVPLTFDLPLEPQVQEVDVVLHKATDEIITVELSGSSEFLNRISYSKGMQELKRYVQGHPDCCVIDPLDNIYPVVDRLRIQQILLGLEGLKTEGQCRIRAPHFLKVDSFNESNLVERLSRAELFLPSIVKPQVACGVADAHNMAIVFRTDDFKDLTVPLPAVIQEYVDHSALLFKFYVLGDKVFHAVKNSTPNSDVFLSSYEKDGLKPLAFNSLKSLPTAKVQSGVSGHSKADKTSLDLELVTDAANWLRRKLDLTIFGFDVVIQEGTRDHVIVDVNYLPSFKELPNDVAIPAFWDAIKNAYESRRHRN